MVINKICAVVIVVAFAIGCSKPEAQKSPKSYKVVEDAVGATAIKQGNAMKNKLKEFEKTQQEREKELETIK